MNNESLKYIAPILRSRSIDRKGSTVSDSVLLHSSRRVGMDNPLDKLLPTLATSSRTPDLPDLHGVSIPSIVPIELADPKRGLVFGTQRTVLPESDPSEGFVTAKSRRTLRLPVVVGLPEMVLRAPRTMEQPFRDSDPVPNKIVNPQYMKNEQKKYKIMQSDCTKKHKKIFTNLFNKDSEKAAQILAFLNKDVRTYVTPVDKYGVEHFLKKIDKFDLDFTQQQIEERIASCKYVLDRDTATPMNPKDSFKRGYWRRLVKKSAYLLEVELQLSKLNLEREELLDKRGSLAKDLVEEHSIKPYWSAQSRDRPFDDMGRSRTLSNDDWDPTEYSATFWHTVDLQNTIIKSIDKLSKIYPTMLQPDEKLKFRQAMEYIENRSRDLNDLARGRWVAQSASYDNLIKQFKLLERINDSTRKGLGKSIKTDRSGPPCYNRPRVETAPTSKSSNRKRACSSFGKERDAKKELIFKAQALMSVGLDERTHNSIDKLQDTFAGLSDGVTIRIDLLSGLKEHFTSVLEKVGDSDTVKNTVAAIVLAFAGAMAVYKKSAVWRSVCIVLGTIAGLYLGAQALGPMNVFLESMKSHDVTEGYEAQASKGLFVPAILTYLYATMFKDLSSKNPVQEFIKKTADMSKWAKGIEFGVDHFMDLIQRFLNWCTVHVGSPEFTITTQPYPEAYAYALECDKYSARFQAGMDLNYENGMEYYSLMARGTTAMGQIPANTAEGREARRLIELTTGAMRHIGAKLSRANIIGNGPRIPPLAVMIAGTTGVGKTDTMPFLINEVTAHVLPDREIETFYRNSNDTTFVRNSEDEFWDGYHGQHNTYTDDLGQTVDIAGTTANAYMEHVRMIGTCNYPLKMAHLEDKGNVNFRSKVVWATTNRPFFELKSMYTNEPFCRRFPLSYVMVPNEDVCLPEERSTALQITPPDVKARVKLHPDTAIKSRHPILKRVMDPTKFPKDRNDRSYARFHKFDLLTGIPEPIGITYEELVDTIVRAYKKNYDNGAEMIKLLQAEKEKAIVKRKEAGAPYAASDGKTVYVKPFEAQSGGDAFFDAHSSVADALLAEIKSTPVQTFNIGPQFTKECIDTAPKFIKNFILNRDYDSVMQELSRQTDLSVDFVEMHVDECMDDWYMLMSNLKVLAESIQFEERPTTRISKLITEYKVKFEPYFKSAKEMALKYKKHIGIVLVALASIRLGLYMFSSSVPEPQSSGGMRKPGQRRNFHTPKPVGKSKSDRFKAFDLKGKNSGGGHMQLRGVRSFESQIGTDGGAVDILRSIVKSNQMTMTMPGHDDPMGKITFICEYIALMPLHFGERLKYDLEEGFFDPDATVKLTDVHGKSMASFHIPVQDLEIRASEHSEANDWCFVRFPSVMPRKRNIVEYFIKRDFEFSDRIDIILNMVRGDEAYLQQVGGFVKTELTEYDCYAIQSGFEYDFATQVGDCGGLLAQCNTSSQKEKLIGIHTAGQGTRGFAPKIVQEELLHLLKAYDMTAEEMEPITSDEIDELREDLPPDTIEGFQAECKARKVNTPRESRIRKSLLHNTFKRPLMSVPKLCPHYKNGELRDPMAMARIKYSKDSVSIHPQLLRAACDDLFSNLINRSVPGADWDPKVFSFETACQGSPGTPFMEAIPRNTSAGYPLALDVPKGEKGKSHIFGADGEFTFDSPECIKLKNRVAHIIAKASKGERLLHVYIDFLKDERRPHAKVKASKVRMISSSPLDLLIAFRMYFLDFVRWIMFNRIRNGSAVGVNTTSTEWQELRDHLASVINEGGGAMAGDHSSYDASITHQELECVLHMVNLWYSDGNEKIRTTLWREVSSSRHIWEDVVYQWCGKNPSGNFMTTILNTLLNALLIKLCHAILWFAYHEHILSPYEDKNWELLQECFKAEKVGMRYICYGDDNIVTVSKAVGEYMNQHTITAAMLEFGFTFTTEAKDGLTVEPLRTLEEVSFLKRKFTVSEVTGRYLCPLDLDVVLEMPQWTTSSDQGFKDLKQTIDGTLRELSLHDKKTFTKWRNRILKYSRRLINYAPVDTRYESLQAINMAMKNLL